jgi:hypothetical protein
MTESTIIQLHPPLPCGALAPTPTDPTARCGQPATVAHAYAVAEDAPNLPIKGLARPGEWIILPVCRECTRKAAAVYEINLTEPKGDPDAIRPTQTI